MSRFSLSALALGLVKECCFGFAISASYGCLICFSVQILVDRVGSVLECVGGFAKWIRSRV